MSQKSVWVVTGTSTGFGREIVLAILNRGDEVIATARNIDTIKDLESAGASILQLDVTASPDSLHQIAKDAVAIHGHVDFVINNAGYSELGTIEELTSEETFKQFNTNVFGPLNVSRAFLPFQRQRKSGTILFMGSMLGHFTTPASGMYCATKHAIRAFAESLDAEITPLGLRALYLEPGHFLTSIIASSRSNMAAPRIADYAQTNSVLGETLSAYDGHQPGDPKKFAHLLVDFVKRQGLFLEDGKIMPAGLIVGTDAYEGVKATLEEKLRVIEEWKDVICSTDVSKAAL